MNVEKRGKRIEEEKERKRRVEKRRIIEEREVKRRVERKCTRKMG